MNPKLSSLTTSHLGQPNHPLQGGPNLQVLAALPLRSKPNTLNFLPASTTFAILQSAHRIAVGRAAKAKLTIRGVTDAATGKRVYKRTRAAQIAFMILLPPVHRNVLLKALFDFVKSERSLDGMEGLYLLGLDIAAKEGNTSLLNDGITGWAGAVLGDERDGGNPFTTFLDVSNGSFSFLDGNDLGQLTNGLVQTGQSGGGLGSGVSGMLSGLTGQGSSGGPAGGSGIPGFGSMGDLGSLGSNVSAVGGNAATDFITSLFGADAANLLSDVASVIGSGISAGKNDAGFGALIGGAVSGIGAVGGSAIGFVVGFISGVIDGVEQVQSQHEASDQAAKDDQAVIDGLTNVLADLQGSLQKLDDAEKQDAADKAAKDKQEGGTPPANEGTGTSGGTTDGKPAGDPPPAPDPPPPGGETPAGDVGNDDTGGGGGSGGGAENFTVGMVWPALENLGGGGTDGSNSGDTLGQKISIKLRPGGLNPRGGNQGEGLGSDTGVRIPEIPEAVLQGLGGSNQNDPGNQGDNLGKKPGLTHGVVAGRANPSAAIQAGVAQVGVKMQGAKRAQVVVTRGG